MKHYVYRITNIKLNKHYYGTRSSKINPSEDIGHIYFSSSSDKLFMQDQKINSSNYIYKVVYIHSTRKKALQQEVKLHQKFDVGINESFYNKSKQTSIKFDTTGNSYRKGCKHSEETKLKISKAHKGKKHSEETKKKLSDAGTGKKFTEEHKQNLSKSLKGQKLSEETKKKISASRMGKRSTEETKNKMSKTRSNLHITVTSRNNPLIFRLCELYTLWLENKEISYYKFEKNNNLENSCARILKYFKNNNPNKDKDYMSFISSFQVS